jgi:C1A family cysteine protease
VVYDQGQLGSCVANAIAAIFEFDVMKEGKRVSTPSRLFIYYNSRMIGGTVDTDSGAMIRDGIKSVAHEGDPPETEWPYDIAKFAVKPPSRVYADARRYKAVQYQRLVQNLTQMKGCLASGHPFVFGFTVYESFEGEEVAKTGQVPMPDMNEPAIGGHAAVAVGYDDSQQRFIVRNSWGINWGIAGYFTMPYAYLTQASLSGEFWTIRTVQ